MTLSQERQEGLWLLWIGISMLLACLWFAIAWKRRNKENNTVLLSVLVLLLGTVCGALGAKLFLPGTRVHGMMVDSDPFEEITLRLMREAAALLEADLEITAADFALRDLCGPGYAIPSEEGNAAVRLLAETEGLFLDPVYTGKAFAGLVQMLTDGTVQPGENVLFLHSGGAGGLFAVEMEDDK